jgi:hypothetical protein
VKYELVRNPGYCARVSSEVVSCADAQVARHTINAAVDPHHDFISI